MRQPVLGESARWLAVATMATMATPKRRVVKKITGSVRWLTPPTPPSHENFFLRVSPEGWPWWPRWPSMIGHESRRPAAKPRLGSGVPRASASVGVESACPWPATTRAATVPPVRPPRLGLGQALTPDQIRDAAARANAGARLGPGTHPGGLGVLNARDTPCPKPAACPVQRRTAGPA